MIYIYIYIVMDLINALPDNSSVNMIQHATMDEAVFYMWSTPSNNNEAVFSVNDRCREDVRFSIVQESSV
jgi:hypothetical protein